MGSSATKVGPIEGHRLWSSTYDQTLNPLLALEQRLLLPELGILNGQRLLDVGCGTGRWMDVARQSGALATGVDLTPRILDEAARKPPLSGRITLGDASRLPFPSTSFDIVLCSFVLGYLEHRDEGIRELARGVKPGGLVIVSDLHPEAVGQRWTSSFRQARTVYEIERRHYDLEEIRASARHYGLRERKVIAARFGEPERPIFRHAGKAERFEEVRDIPALFILIGERPVGGLGYSR